ncbi:DNA-protecting protein DprA [Candidatus Dependentiae bacterium]|nr:MAG: DNA-protecting protein DprA [Candidatus Dependentiae bacterium]
MNTHKNILLHLSLIDGVGPGIIQKIIAQKPKKLPWNDLYTFSLSDWIQFFIQEATAEKIVSGLQNNDWLVQEQSLLEKHQISWTTILDSDYPELLKHIHLPPSVLYWQGTLPSDDIKIIAIVGARKADQYGAHAIDLIVPSLVQYNITIVSGGALGADSMAHRATLDAGGATIAVLGSGLLCPYPRENRRLFGRIVEQGGAVLSAFPLRTEPYPGNFPARNRIIAGLSLGVIVVQAARKSGARITAQFALEQGRDVFAIPGPIDNELSDGCHALVQEGAKLITGPGDVLQEIGIPFEPDDGKRVKKRRGAIKLDDPMQERIVQSCVRPQSIDELANQLKLSLSELQTHLFDLQIAGLIEQDFSGMWKLL